MAATEFTYSKEAQQQTVKMYVCRSSIKEEEI